jgi:hypothetical protein
MTTPMRPTLHPPSCNSNKITYTLSYKAPYDTIHSHLLVTALRSTDQTPESVTQVVTIGMSFEIWRRVNWKMSTSIWGEPAASLYPDYGGGKLFWKVITHLPVHMAPHVREGHLWINNCLTRYKAGACCLHNHGRWRQQDFLKYW